MEPIMEFNKKFMLMLIMEFVQKFIDHFNNFELSNAKSYL